MDRYLNIKTVLSYIENRVAGNLSHNDIAAATGYSLPHIRAMFRDTTGHTLAKYIARRRLSYAAFALAHTHKPVTEIALENGFGSHDAFTRAFRRELGETPSDFRRNTRQVPGTLIVPGVYAPAFTKREEYKMNTENNGHETILYGIPKVSYFNEYHELTPFIATLKACLAYMGQTESYARLHAASGAAFRLIWNTTYWDGGNVDIMLMRDDPTEPLVRAFTAAGRDYRMLCKPGKAGHYTAEKAADKARVTAGDKQDFIRLIKGEIDSGRPVIGFGIIGPPEACIITGYRNDGETLLGWNFFQEMPEFSRGVEIEPCGYFVRNGWYDHEDTIAVMAVGDTLPDREQRAELKEIIRFAISVMETRQVGEEFAGGPAAYEAWVNALENAAEFPKDAPLPLLYERLVCLCDAQTMLVEGRWFAHTYLNTVAEKVPQASEELSAAATIFKEESLLFRKAAADNGFEGMEEKHARNLADPEKRARMAQTFRQAAQLDAQAAEHLRKALSKI